MGSGMAIAYRELKNAQKFNPSVELVMSLKLFTHLLPCYIQETARNTVVMLKKL